MTETNTPSQHDIETVAAFINAGGWLDPEAEDESRLWDCILRNEHGKQLIDGCAYTPGEAMAWAWVCAWNPDAQIKGVNLTELPAEIPNGWTFELLPPGTRYG